MNNTKLVIITILAILGVFLVGTVAFAAQPLSFATPPKKVAVFLEAPLTFISNEKVRKDFPEKIKLKLEKINCSILDFDECQTALKTYREDNSLIVSPYYSDPLKRDDIQKIAQELKADYAIYIQVANNAPSANIGMFDVDFQTTITCDLKIVNIETGKYVLNKSIVKDGKSTSGFFSYGSYDKAYNNALGKALDEIEFTYETFTK